MKKFYLIIGIIILFHSLISSSQTIDVAKGLKTPGQLSLSQVADTIELVQLEMTLDSYLPRLGDIRISSNYIVALCDFQEYVKVVLFTQTGKFIRKIGSKGKGPGEFNRPNRVLIDSEERFILVTEYHTGRILKYSISGEHLKTINIKNINPSERIGEIAQISANQIAVCPRRPVKPADNFFSLLILDNNLNLINKALPQENDMSLLSHRYISRICQTINDTIFFWEESYDRIFALDQDLHIVGEYSFDIHNNKIVPKVRINRRIKESNYRMLKMIRIIGSNFVFYHCYQDKCSMMAYNRFNGETFVVDNDFGCDTSYLASIHFSLPNDLYGFEPTRARYPQNHMNSFIDVLWPTGTERNLVLHCLKSKKVKYPNIRDEIVEILRNYENYEMPILLIHKRR